MSPVSPEAIRRARSVDLLARLGPQVALRRVAAAQGGEYAGPCPFCGGRDRFVVQPARGRWMCRRCAPRWDDAIALQQKRTLQTFPEAVAALAGGRWPSVTLRASQPEPPPLLWQVRAQTLADQAAAALLAPAGRPALKRLLLMQHQDAAGEQGAQR
jgi:phage/plasmid primase-like uncharacterized protein